MTQQCRLPSLAPQHHAGLPLDLPGWLSLSLSLTPSPSSHSHSALYTPALHMCPTSMHHPYYMVSSTCLHHSAIFLSSLQLRTVSLHIPGLGQHHIQGQDSTISRARTAPRPGQAFKSLCRRSPRGPALAVTPVLRGLHRLCGPAHPSAPLLLPEAPGGQSPLEEASVTTFHGESTFPDLPWYQMVTLLWLTWGG